MHIRKYEGKTGITYQAIVKVKGKSDSATFHTKAQAREWGVKRESDLLNDLYFPEKARRNNTLGDAITRYRERILPHLAKNSIRVRRRTLAFWERNLGDTTLNNITPAMIEDYLYLLDQKGLAPKSINAYREILSILFNLASSPGWGMTKHNPIKHVKRRTLGPEYVPLLSLQQQQDLLNSCKESRTNYLYLVVLLCLRTGARHQEALTATWSQINWMQKTIRYINTKGKVDRIVPLDSQLYKELRRRYDSRELLDNLYIFCNPNTGRPYHRIKVPFNTARKRLGKDFPHITVHGLRHLFATNCAEYLGMNAIALANLMGHKNLQQLKRYQHISNKHIASVLNDFSEQLQIALNNENDPDSMVRPAVRQYIKIEQL